MADLVTSQEAAALWGCSWRNIHHYVRAGKLVPVTFVARVIERPTAGRVTIQVPLFKPADVLALRKHRNHARVTRGRAQAARNNKRRAEMLRAYYRLPKSERKGRDWMTKAYNLLHLGVPK